MWEEWSAGDAIKCFNGFVILAGDVTILLILKRRDTLDITSEEGMKRDWLIYAHRYDGMLG